MGTTSPSQVQRGTRWWLLLGLSLAVGLLRSEHARAQAQSGSVPAQTSTAQAPPSAEPTRPSDAQTVIHVAGDVSYPSGWVGQQACEASGPQLFDEVRPLLAEGAVNFANLEMPLTSQRATLVKPAVITAKPYHLEWLLKAGLNLLSLANNHMVDAGKAGLEETLQTLRAAAEKQPLSWAGAGLTQAEAQALTVTTAKGSGLRVGLLAVGNIDAPQVAHQDSKFHERVAQAAKAVDVLMVSVHAGQEYHHSQSASAAHRYRRLIDAGAKVVLVHHAHVVSGVERYHQGVIFHGLGNFSFCSNQRRYKATGAQMYGMLGRLVFAGSSLVGVGVIPLYVGNVEPLRLKAQVLPPRFGRPQVLHGAFAQAVLTAIIGWSKAAPLLARHSIYELRDDQLWIKVDAPLAGPSQPTLAASP